jgi:hypothetical protein
VLSRLVGGAADWVSTHADELRAVSNVLKGVSAVAGLLSFIPVLTPIFAPIAAVSAVGALAIDAALVATGRLEVPRCRRRVDGRPCGFGEHGSLRLTTVIPFGGG